MGNENDFGIENRAVLDYEKDPQFIEYIKSRLNNALKAKDEGKLIDSTEVFANLRQKYGWNNE